MQKISRNIFRLHQTKVNKLSTSTSIDLWKRALVSVSFPRPLRRLIRNHACRKHAVTSTAVLSFRGTVNKLQFATCRMWLNDLSEVIGFISMLFFLLLLLQVPGVGQKSTMAFPQSWYLMAFDVTIEMVSLILFWLLYGVGQNWEGAVASGIHHIYIRRWESNPIYKLILKDICGWETSCMIGIGFGHPRVSVCYCFYINFPFVCCSSLVFSIQLSPCLNGFVGDGGRGEIEAPGAVDNSYDMICQKSYQNSYQKPNAL